jgi:tetratricopeptide (TPR) repeat protein/transcriptional regulator with XRE-family HTH domain
MPKSAKAIPNLRLKEVRELRGWSQKYVADQIGADNYYLSRWEHGTASPSPYYRRKLCLLFGMDAKELGLLREEITEDAALPIQQSGSSPASSESLRDPAIPLPFAGGYGLVGRDDIVNQLKQRLFNSRNVVLTALNGLPGVGKTSLAVALAYDDEIVDYFHDGILWAGLGPQPNVLSTLSRWGMLLGIASAEIAQLNSIEDWIRVIHTSIGDRKLLLVIDDVWRLEDVLACKVGGLHCAYIVTTRFPQLAIQFTADGTTVVEELNEDDSVALLARLAPDFVTNEPGEAQALARAVGGLPLALTLIGKYLRTQTYSGQLRRLRTALARLQNAETRMQLIDPQALIERSPSLPANKPVSLQNLIELSDQHLDEQARSTLRALSAFPAKPNSFSEEAALAVCNLPVETLDALSDVGLLEARGPERYALHQTIADYARTHLTDTTVYQRLTRYYADYVEAHEKDFDALDQESVNIFAALQIAYEHGYYADLIRGMNAYIHFLDVRGLYEQAEIYLKQAREAATLSHDHAGLAATLLHSGDVMIRQGEYARAEIFLQEGLTLARQIDHREYTVGLLQSFGMLDQRRGEYQQAEMHLQEALVLARQSRDFTRISLLLKNLGTLEAIQGNYNLTEVYMQESLAVARQIGDQEVISLSLLNLGQLSSERGDYVQAEILLQEALTQARQLGHREVISLLLNNLGVLAGDQKDYAQAESYFQEGLAVARQIGYRERTGLLLTNLGWIASEQGNYTQAESYIQESVSLASQVGNQWLLCGSLKFQGDLQVMQKQYEAAVMTFHKVLEIAAEGNPRMKGEALFGLAEVAAAQENFVEARKQAEASLAVFESIGQNIASKVKSWLHDLPVTNS